MQKYAERQNLNNCSKQSFSIGSGEMNDILKILIQGIFNGMELLEL